MLSFSLHLEIRLLLTIDIGVIGAFSPLMKVFIMDQYVLLLSLQTIFLFGIKL